jgi:hypothetical protein
LIENVQEALDKGISLKKMHETLNSRKRSVTIKEAKEPLAETAEFFPELWEETLALAKEIPQDRQDYYQFHFTYQVAVHMYSCRMLATLCDAYEAFEKDGDAHAFAEQMALVSKNMENIITEAHKAEYGIWDTMFLHVRLMDFWRTRLMLKKVIAKINNEPYTSDRRGYWGGSFWGDAQEYMEHGDGVFPYFYKHSGRGLDVLEDASKKRIND